MLLDIRHETTYSYAAPVKHSIQYLRLSPRSDGAQRVLNWRIEAPGRRVAQRDAFGNTVHVLTVDQPHQNLRIVVAGKVETEVPVEGMLIAHDSAVPPLAYALETPLTASDAAVRALSAKHLQAGKGEEASLLRLSEDILAQVQYLTGSTTVHSTAIEALRQGQGVCQDHAHLFIAACRAANLPARYVSGYLFTGDSDHLASHAWAEAWVERPDATRPDGSSGSGWFAIDVTHAHQADQQTVRLAVGRDYMDAAPVRGARRGGGAEAMEVRVLVGQQ